jgi:hypothetical protein
VQQRALYATKWRSDLQSRVEAPQGMQKLGKDTLEFLFVLIFIVKEEIKLYLYLVNRLALK